MSSAENKRIIQKCMELFNKYTFDWVDKYYSDKLEWVELSNPMVPQGRKGDINTFRKAAEQALSLFPDRTLTVMRSISENDCVVLEQVWQGTLATTAGNHRTGEIAKLQIASIFTLENGLIIKQTDYCAASF